MYVTRLEVLKYLTRQVLFCYDATLVLYSSHTTTKRVSCFEPPKIAQRLHDNTTFVFIVCSSTAFLQEYIYSLNKEVISY